MNRPGARRTRHLLGGMGVLAVVALTCTACKEDGKTLRPARPDQVGSVSTLAPPSTDIPAFEGGDFTLPAESTVVPTAPTTSTPVSTTTVVATDETGAGASGEPQLTTSWRDGAPIDARYTCDGADLAPALRWTTPPEETVEIAVTLRDEDAPSFVHWAMAGIDPLSTSLGEAQTPEFALVSRNSSGELGYIGPCPPAGETHRYVLTVHFLGEQTELPDGSDGADLLTSIDDRSLASASVSGVYSRP